MAASGLGESTGIGLCWPEPRGSGQRGSLQPPLTPAHAGHHPDMGAGGHCLLAAAAYDVAFWPRS